MLGNMDLHDGTKKEKTKTSLQKKLQEKKIMVKGGETMRVDNELAEMIRDAAEKNEIGIREASKEISPPFCLCLDRTKISRSEERCKRYFL